MRILVACEESQTETIEFRKLGHEAYSCDIQECSGGHPEWHIKADALELLKMKWDMIIAHPPCTYLSNAGACRMYPHKGHIDEGRLAKAMEAREFFMRFYEADCPRIAIENPRPLRIVDLPPESQRIQPYQFGEPWSKMTYLWLKGLFPLMSTCLVENYRQYVSCGTSRTKGKADKAGASRAGGAQKARSKAFVGIARAMAEQWAGDARGG